MASGQPTSGEWRAPHGCIAKSTFGSPGEIMSMTDSDFVIRLHRTFKDTQHVYFLLEAALGGSLIQAGQSA